jgi:hypothetical protein
LTTRAGTGSIGSPPSLARGRQAVVPADRAERREQAHLVGPLPGSNGQTRYPGPTLWGDHVNHKWGVYRSGGNTGHATALLNHAKLGRTYADVAA